MDDPILREKLKSESQEYLNGKKTRLENPFLLNFEENKHSKKIQILLLCLSFIFAAVAVVAFTGWGKLKIQNVTLTKERGKLHETIEKIEQENKSALANLENERMGLSKALADFKKSDESLKAELAKTKEDLRSLTEEKSYLEDILITKTKENEALRKNQSGGGTGVPILATGDIAQQLRQKDEEINRLNSKNLLLSKKIENLYKITNEKIAAINVAKITLEDTIVEARKNIDSQFNAVDLGSIAVNQAGTASPKQTAAAPQQTQKNPASAIRKEGKVLALNEEYGFVVVNIGKVDGVTPNTVFSIKRNGQTIGELSVLEVRDVMTACNIKDLNQGQKIQINDLVLIRK